MPGTAPQSEGREGRRAEEWMKKWTLRRRMLWLVSVYLVVNSPQASTSGISYCRSTLLSSTLLHSLLLDFLLNRFCCPVLSFIAGAASPETLPSNHPWILFPHCPSLGQQQLTHSHSIAWRFLGPPPTVHLTFFFYLVGWSLISGAMFTPQPCQIMSIGISGRGL
ncbi:hypothetical protein BDV59DRAFT_156091 [Aspergillus ambiguus]|uniref:uncharacterized protein n=1 Tax=Aspergillus ambiguus TaxID=176160 RepID=UPI003CCE20E7